MSQHFGNKVRNEGGKSLHYDRKGQKKTHLHSTCLKLKAAPAPLTLGLTVEMVIKKIQSRPSCRSDPPCRKNADRPCTAAASQSEG